MKKSGQVVLFAIILSLFASCSSPPTTENKLREWRRGVWVSGGGTYTIWTDTHYFVVSASGDSTRANIYCGSSRVRYTDKGIARHQNLRVRQTPSRPMLISGDFSMFSESEEDGLQEAPLEIDESMFAPGTCNIVDGVIYDSVTEETADFILLFSCNGDRTKLFNDGRSLYLASDGGEHWSHRIEAW